MSLKRGVGLTRSAVLSAIVLTVLYANSTFAQSTCDSAAVVRESQLAGVAADYARALELSPGARINARLARRLSDDVPIQCHTGPWRMGVDTRLGSWITLSPLSISSTYNSSYPEDRNNGPMWAGRGVSLAAVGGVILAAGPVTAGILPEVTSQQNRNYETLPALVIGRSTYSSGLYTGIDEPQRFGPRAYTSAGIGQSFVSVKLGKLRLGASHENIWWGPGISNAILFTNTAPGFPHLYLNLTSPVSVGVGKLNFEAIWGRLSESRYFDNDPSNDHRAIVGGIVTLAPNGIRGLFVGFGRTFVVPLDSLTLRNAFPFWRGFVSKGQVSPSNPQGNTNDDQRLSLIARYVLPESGFEIYGEWAREDAAWDWSDFVQEPEHSSGHVLGLQKVFTPELTRSVRFYTELTNLQQLRQDRPAIRPTPSFYVHGPQGHTEEGQLLGASIGPGSEAQLVGTDVFSANGLLGAYFERVRRDEFSAAGIAAWSTTWPPRHDVALTAGLRLAHDVAGFKLAADLARSKRYNRNFLKNEWNTDLGLLLLRTF